MIILYGAKTFTKQGGRTHTSLVCQSCGRTTPMNLYRARTWFTLFFLPLFPVHTRFIAQCPYCGNQIKDKAFKGQFNFNMDAIKSMKKNGQI